ncbi:hypothetical protein VNO77_18872 [Canavalia gladiata]|uniref:Uncharacterized protein n=1 Tax=Canavalia gladiata TaxID=3824 RepID=A0AAN9QP32_CANGL
MQRPNKCQPRSMKKLYRFMQVLFVPTTALRMHDDYSCGSCFGRVVVVSICGLITFKIAGDLRFLVGAQLCEGVFVISRRLDSRVTTGNVSPNNGPSIDKTTKPYAFGR